MLYFIYMKNKNNSKPPKKNIINANVSREVLRGIYSNAFKIVATDNEVYIDFAFIFDEDGAKQAEVGSRIILRPEFARSFGVAVVDAIDKHQKKNEKTKK
jgi:hypothetical protein